MGRTRTGYVCVCLCVIHLLGSSKAETLPEANLEHSHQSSADVIMREDAEEMFYSIDLEKYDGVRCPDPVPPKNGAIIGEGNQVGSVVYIQCRPGYKVEGSPVLACVPTSDGAHWDAMESRLCIESSDKDNRHETAFSASAEPETQPGIQSSSGDRISMSADSAQRSRQQDESHNILVRHGLVEPDPAGLSPMPLYCSDKPEAGPCRASFKRYYFSKTTMECHTFVYGGCQGNENNFHTLRDCNLACLGHE
ncbi:hypothetical protein BsWGS_18323 [Bradybaena similaris]